MSGSNKLIKGMAYVLLANIINMFFNLITNFILPKYLSVDSYACIKTYQLYISYIGALHLGFIDGIYLRYGGKSFTQIDENELARNLGSLRKFQLLMAIIFIVISYVINDNVLLYFAFAVIPLNLINYFTSVYQASGEFNRYGKIINATAALNCIANLLIIFVLKKDDYKIFLSAYVITSLLIWVALEATFSKKVGILKSLRSFSIHEIADNCKAGILLMLGNLSSFVLTGLDRWFVKFLMNTAAFAYYSFAVSIESFLNIAMNPVTVTLYNYFCKHQDKVGRVKNCIILFSSFIIATAFPAKFILEVFLNKYIDSCIVMFVLFSAQIFSMLNKGLYINLYKAQRKQKSYFLKLVIVIISGALFNIICFAVYPVKESFAVGTLLSSILWFLLNKSDFKYIKFKLNEYVFIFMTIFVFLLCGILLESILGLFLYLIYLITASLILMKTDVIFIKEYVLESLLRRKQKT